MLTLLSVVLALTVSDPPLRVIDFCTLPGNRCGALSELELEASELLQELWWCCPYSGNEGCALVADGWACDPEAEYAVWCEWGRTVPQSSETGTVDCYW